MQFDEKKIRRLLTAVDNIIVLIDGMYEWDVRLDAATDELEEAASVIRNDYSVQGE